MARIVQKFGGTSVADIGRIRHVAQRIAGEVRAGGEVAVVISAMAGETDRLVGLCRTVTPLHDGREYDAVVSAGEQISSGLLAIALQEAGIPARSWQGWQIPLETEGVPAKARIANIKTDRLTAAMAAGEVPVIAGFQGLNTENRIATLGRGGSDTSAVALAAALKAERCDIYTDVDGVYTTDPRIAKCVRKLAKISFEEMLEMASVGARVLQTRSVEMAMKHNVRLQVLSTFATAKASDLPGTMVVPEEEIVERTHISGIALSRDEAKITLLGVPDKPGVAARIIGALADVAIPVDMIVQNISPDGTNTDMTFTVAKSDMSRAVEELRPVIETIGCADLKADDDIAKVSIIGIGIRSNAGVTHTMFAALAERGINIEVISASEIRVSVLIRASRSEDAVRILHTAFGLDVTGKAV
ncbi:MAG: aspartate kinase [Pseudomonadota bacterium]|nr:aspartate kinase [Pseudomonadota bacterium]